MGKKMDKEYEFIVIGASAGGFTALTTLLGSISPNLKLPIAIVLHISSSDNGLSYLSEYMNKQCKLKVSSGEQFMDIKSGNIYIASPEYHLLIESNKTLSLCSSEKVKYSRPSIDVLFETAADVYQDKLIGILLTGANTDGANGMKYIQDRGGTLIVQNPKTAEVNTMPSSAIKICNVDYVLELEEIIDILNKLTKTVE